MAPAADHARRRPAARGCAPRYPPAPKYRKGKPDQFGGVQAEVGGAITGAWLKGHNKMGGVFAPDDLHRTRSRPAPLAWWASPTPSPICPRHDPCGAARARRGTWLHLECPGDRGVPVAARRRCVVEPGHGRRAGILHQRHLPCSRSAAAREVAMPKMLHAHAGRRRRDRMDRRPTEPVIATACVVAADLNGAAMMVPKTLPRSWLRETLATFALASLSGALAAGVVGALDFSCSCTGLLPAGERPHGRAHPPPQARPVRRPAGGVISGTEPALGAVGRGAGRLSRLFWSCVCRCLG